MKPSDLLRAARNSQQLTQVQLAARAGTSQTAISAYENGARSPSLETFERLLAASGSRLVVEAGAQPVRRPTAAQRERNGKILFDVLALAEELPTRHEPSLRFPVLKARPRA